jgi:hypothetical protein
MVVETKGHSLKKFLRTQTPPFFPLRTHHQPVLVQVRGRNTDNHGADAPCDCWKMTNSYCCAHNRHCGDWRTGKEHGWVGRKKGGRGGYVSGTSRTILYVCLSRGGVLVGHHKRRHIKRSVRIGPNETLFGDDPARNVPSRGYVERGIPNGNVQRSATRFE